MAQSYVNLQRYLGDVSFNALARSFGGTGPAELTTSRLHFNTLPKFLRTYKPFQRAPEIQELAALELALQVAFEAPDVRALLVKDLNSIRTSTRLQFHPSAQCLQFFQNTTSLWSALISEQRPPKPHQLDHVQHVVVWRQGTGARFRIVGGEEAQAFKVGTANAAQPYLRTWVEAELVLPLPRIGEMLEK